MGEENSLRKKREEMEKNLDKDPVDFDVVSKESQEEGNGSDKKYIPEEKKEKYDFNTFGKMNDDMLDKYKHPRHSLRSARTYTVMSKMLSELHMSKRQIEGAIVTITNMLFSQEWKPYNKHQTPDLDTLPSIRNILQIEPFFEAMALNAIVEETMKDVTISTVYANDGSSRSGVGSYIV